MFKTTSPRDYNHIQEFENYLIKSSIQEEKIKREAQYFMDLPEALVPYHANFLGKSSEGKFSCGYKIEKIGSEDLSLSLVQGDLTPSKVSLFFSELGKYFDLLEKKNVGKEAYLSFFRTQVVERNRFRISLLQQSPYYSHVNSLFEEHGGIADFAQKLIGILTRELSDEKPVVCFSHGDLCFSNILLTDRLLLIDPRGKDEHGYFMPLYYDLAKLSQCIYGHYDYINHKSDLDITEVQVREDLDSGFKALLDLHSLSFRCVRLFECMHFLAMLPLHLPDHEKVDLFARRTLRVFEDLKKL